MENEYISFINNCPTPYHVVEKTRKILINSNFQEIKKLEINMQPGSYFIVIERTMIVAFIVPKKIKSIKIIATHNDSPVLKIKPKCDWSKNNMNLVSLMPYGGGLWHTWFDRQLGVAGLLVYEDLSSELVKIDNPVLYIPSLAIHLDNTGIYKEGFSYNKQVHLNAIRSVSNQKGGKNFIESLNLSKNILSFDLSAYDLKNAALGGENNSLIFGSRQDNLFSTFCGIKAITSLKNKSEEANSLNILGIFDNEEIGSQTVMGAKSFINFMNELASILKFNVYEIKENSLIISCDVAHCSNPNYSEKTEERHQIEMGNGIVIKSSPRYATNVITSSIFKKIVLNENEKFQEFVLRNDMFGGCTIGPMLAYSLGIRCIDVGAPILGMHSIQEVACVDDLHSNVKIFKAFFKTKNLGVN